MPNAKRYLGFGFAAADLLIELKADDRVGFALGAGESVLGIADRELVDRNWHDLIDAADHAMVDALFYGLDSGARAGPVTVGIASPDGAPTRYASLSVIRLPQNKGAISCALSRASERGPVGVQDRTTFEARAADLLASASQDLELSFVDLAGLSKSGVDSAKLQTLVAGALRAQAYRGEAPTAVGLDRYAMVRGVEHTPEVMSERVTRVLARAGVEGVTLESASMPLTGATRPKQVIQAMRYALTQVLENGLSQPLPADLSEALDKAMQSTLDKAGALGAAIRERRFRLAYQPVVSLADGSLHHHEVLVRFGYENSPFPTIRLAEEMELIEPLDLAILDETIIFLKENRDLKLAVNVSGRSLMSESYVQAVLGLLKGNPAIRGRLLFELTESAAVEDLGLADRYLQSFRAAGCEICLDDFGAGAASLAYLQQLTLDMLKIDGRYIRDLQHGGRESTFVKHLVNMCAELKVQTLAEMVETPEAEDAVRRAGVDFAQGWLYGRAADMPMESAALMARHGVRQGALSVRSALER